jgi:hypothetical protein
MRHAARVDANQEQIVSALRAAGAYVWIIGLPVDLLVGYKNHTFLVEIKTDSKKRLTKLQADFFENWVGGTLCRIDNAESALRMLKVADEQTSTKTS